MRTSITALVGLLALVACASPGLPVDESLGSLGPDDPSILEGQVSQIDVELGILVLDVRKIDGEFATRRGVRIQLDENTVFVNHSSFDEIRHIREIPGTIVEVEGWNDHGVYTARTVALKDVPPDHPVWRPGH